MKKVAIRNLLLPQICSKDLSNKVENTKTVTKYLLSVFPDFKDFVLIVFSTLKIKKILLAY